MVTLIQWAYLQENSIQVALINASICLQLLNVQSIAPFFPLWQCNFHNPHILTWWPVDYFYLSIPLDQQK